MSTLHALNAVPMIFSAKDCWFMFHTLMVGGIAHLEVYRSLQLPADHEWLAPANELLSRFDHDVVSCEVVDDSTMWMCTAERVLYLLKPPPEAA